MHMSYFFYLFFFKQKTAYGVRISDWSSAVCSSDLRDARPPPADLTGRPDVDLVEAVADFRRWLSAQPAEPKTLDLVGQLETLASHFAGSFATPPALDRKSTRLNSSH